MDERPSATTDGDAAALLRRVPLFHTLAQEDLASVAGALHPHHAAAGDLIVREGEDGHELFVITQGGVRVMSDGNPNAVLLARLGPGEFFGEATLLQGGPRTAAVVADVDTDFLTLQRADFNALTTAHPGIRTEALRVWTRREERADVPGEANEAVSLLALPRTPGAVVTIGRGDDNDIVVPDPTVSRRHAEIVRDADGDGLRLRDLGSMAGTFRNRARVRDAPLADGDAIQIGAARLFLRDGVLKRHVLSRGVRVEAVGVGRRVGRDRAILRNVDLGVSPGELVAIVGSSGAGKTTLLRSLLGLHPLDSGEVYYDSAPLRANLDLYRQTLGYVPQDDIVHPELTVDESLWYAARLRLPADLTETELRDRIDVVLGQVGLSAARATRVGDLSGGQRKRASIAAELLARPRAFFLDEPTSGLDPGLTYQIMKLLRELADQGRTVVFTTHATRSIDICDRVCVLTGGRAVFMGPPAEALDYFHTDDFVQMYDVLETAPAAELAERYASSAAYERNVALRLITPRGETAETVEAPAAPAGAQAVRRLAHQTRVLIARNLRLMAADRMTLLLRLFGAPLIGATLLLVFDGDIFALTKAEGGNVVNVVILFHILGAVSIFLGSTNAATEITREQSVYLRERLVALSPLAYILAKVSVLGALSVVQSLLLVGVVALGITFSAPAGETFVLLFLAATMASLTGMGMGLLVSALSRNSDQAITAAVVLLIPQLILAGAIVPLREMLGPARVLAEFMMSKWALELFGGLADLDTRVVHQSILQIGQITIRVTDHPFRDAFTVDLVWRWLVLAAFTLAFVGAVAVIQYRKGRA